MFQIPAIKFSMRKPKILKAKTWRAILKRAWWETGRFWHRHILPKKFTPRGAREYKYEKRGGEDWKEHWKGYKSTYTWRKRRDFGHVNPLEYTGDLKRAAMSIRRVESTSKGATIILTGLPSYAKMMPHGIGSPNMQAELKAISRGDKAAMEKFLNRRIQAGIRKAQRGAAFSVA